MTGRPKDYSVIPAPGTWTQRALCKGRLDEFFGREHVPPELVAVCAVCPVHDECLSYALRCEVVGIWGGTSWRERERIRRHRRAIA